MTVSFCVIAYNEEKSLPSLLNDIKNQNYPHDKMEIILVNSMSNDKTKEMMQEFAREDNGFIRIKVIDNYKKTQAAGWNIAIKAAQEEVIVRIDAHTMIPKDFISKNIKCLEAGEYVSGGPRPNIAAGETVWQHTILIAEKSMFGSNVAPFRKGEKKAYVKSIFHGAYRREVFDKAGLFDERLGRTEDNEIHFRIRKAGYRLCYDPSIISYQQVRSTLRQLIKQKYGNGYWIGLTLKICPYCFSIYHFIPLCFVMSILVTALLAALDITKIPLFAVGMVYCAVDIIMSVLAIIKDKFHLYYLLLPIIFLILHLSYGIGTLMGILSIPFWKEEHNGQNKKE